MLKNKKSIVSFSYNEQQVDARSMMSLLMLLAKEKAEITVSVEGEDAKKTMQEIVVAFDNCFGET